MAGAAKKKAKRATKGEGKAANKGSWLRTASWWSRLDAERAAARDSVLVLFTTAELFGPGPVSSATPKREEETEELGPAVALDAVVAAEIRRLEEIVRRRGLAYGVSKEVGEP
jgi:hypothetical protein